MACLRHLCGRRVALLLTIVLMLAGGCSSGRQIAASTASFSTGTGFVEHKMDLDGRSQPLWIFVPRDYSPQKKYPAILFLHGLFEAGGNGSASLSAGLGPVIASRPDDWPFITIFPQSTGTWRGESRHRLALSALNYAQSKYSIDADRVILAGLSYGGLGTWEIGARYRDRFAALVPVSGHRATEIVGRVAMLPVWAFAMTGDMFVPAQSSQDMCDAIAARGGKAKLTEFQGIGHDCWDRAIAESTLVSWMLAQKRQPTALLATAGTGAEE